AIAAFCEAGARGIVLMGLAPGRPANGERDEILRATEAGVLIIQSTRAARPSVPGQEFLRRDGVFAGGDLTPHKLRIVLMLLLASGIRPEEMQDEIFRF